MTTSNDSEEIKSLARELKELTTYRSSIKGRVTRFKNYLNSVQDLEIVSPFEIIKLRSMLNKFEILFGEFNDTQGKIERINGPTLDTELNIRDIFEQDFHHCIALAQQMIDRHSPTNNDQSDRSQSSRRSSLHYRHGEQGDNSPEFKLPEIKIPNFDGTYFKWLEFRESFTDLVHNNSRIKNIHKFYYLNSYLKGEAANVVANLEVTNDNYVQAWNLLCERYNDKRQLIDKHLNSLFNFETSKEPGASLCNMVDHVTKTLRALKSMGLPTDSWDALVIHEINNRLDNQTSFKWEEAKGSLSEIPKLDEFFKFLRDRAKVLSSRNRNKNSPNKNNHTNLSPCNRQRHTRALVLANGNKHTSSSSPSSICLLCKDNHKLCECPIFKNKCAQDRLSAVASMKLCLNCLRSGHSNTYCRNRSRCRFCRLTHHSLLHDACSWKDSEEPKSSVAMSTCTSAEVLLCTAEVNLINPSTGKSMTVRALLDSGSQSSFITKRVMKALRLTSQPCNTNIVGIGTTSLNFKPELCSARLQSKASTFSALVSCLVLPSISGRLPKASLNVGHFNLSGFQLADTGFNKSNVVDMLIGADLFWSLIEPEQHSLGENNPVLRKSKLGWLVGGPMLATEFSSQGKETHCNFSLNETLVDLHKDLAKFWELEKVPDSVVASEEERQAEGHFCENTTRTTDGHFCVRLPLRDERNCLGDSFGLARKRFINLEQRFKKKPLLKELYLDFINEYSALGHLTEHDESSSSEEIKYYLPHHPVFKETSESTKLRVVFDASARSTSGFSVNDIQMTGPTIQDSLFNILIRFRTYKYILSGDIEKMFRQVLMDRRDQGLQLILWRSDESSPLRTLRLKTVTYGFSSASFLSTRCLWQIGQESKDSTIREIIQRDFYMDDLLTGAQSEEELMRIRRLVSDALHKGGFHLRKYRSNISNFYDGVQADATNEELLISNATSTLGIGWSPSSDELFFPFSSVTGEVTKRRILSSAFKIFDPLGLLSPCTIRPKMLIQELWKSKVDWDEPVPAAIETEWLKFCKIFEQMSLLKIQRNILINNPTRIELHCFNDASVKAYGSCLYLRSMNAQGDIYVRLLCSKSRVAPIAATTIPRLELCAAVLGAQLTSGVLSAFRFKIDKVFYWTDSKIVISWLLTSKNLKTFVSNRVATITDLADKSHWRYVPTSQNPADLISRGVNPQTLPDATLWWEGAPFLQLPETSWPEGQPQKDEVDEPPEVKAHPALVGETSSPLPQVSRLGVAQGAFARILRWFHNSKRGNASNILKGPFTASELKNSMNKLIKLSQRNSFPIEINLLSQNKALKSNSNIASLNVFIDEEGILRVGGRIEKSNFDFDKQHPVLLHSKCHLTKLIFQNEHRRLMHAGPQLLLTSIRNRFWPLGGRNLARQVSRNCLTCSKLRGRAMSNIMGNLPPERVNPDSPFSSVGTDFAGPFLITDRKGRGCKITKCYLCIFICFNYKCIHLEAVSDLTKDAFLLTLKRFIARRGLPSKVFCDNGTNFVGAAREIKEFLKSQQNIDSILEFTARQGIQFIFTPPYAPTFGGYHEAGVKSAKFHLNRVMGNTHLTFEELSSLFAQIEAILNSRPLCPLSPSPHDFQALTPGHFLIGRPLTALPTPALEDCNTSRLDRYQRLEQIRQHYWKRWSNEYVCELQQRTKWRSRCRDLKVDDLVVLKDDNAPPLCWKLGRVTKIFPGEDGVPRVADITTARGVVRRALNRICLLPSVENSEN